MPKIQVIKAGVLSSIQDAGRKGIRKFGFPEAGVMDLAAMYAANKLLGNDPNAAVIEMALSGGTYIFDAPAFLSICGAKAPITKNGKAIHTQRVIAVQAGDELSIGSFSEGLFSYMAIQGGFQVPIWMQSASTLLSVGKGGLHGDLLEKGDEIPYLLTDSKPHLFRELDYALPERRAIRVYKGPEWHLLSEESQEQFLQSFRLGSEISRMGYRLEGATLKCYTKEIASSAVFPGTIQLPGQGLPIVLMKDAQTTGGYPRIAQVFEEDLAILVQSRPGQEVQFTFEQDKI